MRRIRQAFASPGVAGRENATEDLDQGIAP
jgi:hypothetical protein